MSALTATTLALSLAATHHAMPGDFNERHVAARLDHGHSFATAYHNSEDRVSFGVGLRAEHEWKHVTGFCEGALVTGYSFANVVPLGRCGIDRDNVSFWTGPAVNHAQDISLVFGIELTIAKWRIGQ